ncbi:MAG TPA: 4Fe-4S binding protein [Burkholderiaceae bacterium]|nr:4Fe-4S binding protein [Burkholderiaceae bacterium]
MAVARLAAFLLLGLGAALAHAGILDADSLRKVFPSPLIVGAKDTAIPVWPIFKQNGPSTDLVGYAYESIDLAPIPGFSGSPIDLLVLIDPDGRFLDVRVLSHHEPVFLDGLGEEPMRRFVAQYRDLGLKQAIRIATVPAGALHANGSTVTIDGVAKATASVRIINQTLLAASLQVARAKLGFTGTRDPDLVAHVRSDRFEKLDWNGLVGRGLVQQAVVSAADARTAFAGSAAADDLGPGPADGAPPLVQLDVALATVPSAGRNLLDPRGWAQLNSRIRDGDHVLLVMARGPWSPIGEDLVRGAVPDRIGLSQGGLPIEIRDLDLDATLAAEGRPPCDAWRAFRIIAQAGFDPGQPFDIVLRVTRSHGVVYPERVSREFRLPMRVPADVLIAGASDEKSWRASWLARWPLLAILAAALGALAVVLARRAAPVATIAALRRFRPAFLVFTLVFVGWFAQGQLSIVNVVAAGQAIAAGRGLAFMLNDPVTTMLWIFVLATLVAWGRGTFCGWLCPFGALQELVAAAASLAPPLRALRWRVAPRVDRALRRLKFLVLAAIAIAALASPHVADMLVEIEPFKTAITLAFVRSWPFVAYAVALVAGAVVLHKPFCRYLCPLGAALAVAGRARRSDWIARRTECGQPCQTCRHRCEYDAIDARGRVDYDECFQCMDCVAIYHDDERCAPRVLERKGRAPLRVVAISARPTGAVLQASASRIAGEEG